MQINIMLASAPGIRVLNRQAMDNIFRSRYRGQKLVSLSQAPSSSPLREHSGDSFAPLLARIRYRFCFRRLSFRPRCREAGTIAS